MTRREILARARDLWQEALGSESWGDPLGVDRELSTVADELARRKKCWYGLRFVDLVAAQESYSLVNTIELRRVYLSGRLLDLYSLARVLRDSRRYAGLTAGSPAFAVDGGQTLYLAPASSVAVSGGLGLLGFHNPGVGAGCLWPGLDDHNPLPAFTDEAVSLGLAFRRASLYVGSAEMMARAASLTARFEKEMRLVEAEAHRHYQRVEGLGRR